MKILITGGAGYLGSEMCKSFLPEHEVVVIDKLMYDSNSLLRYTQDNKFTFIKEDVTNISVLKEHMTSADIIIPLAALVGFPLCRDNPNVAQEINHDINRWIAKNKSTDQLVIYPCTNSGYGVSVDGSVCTEESPLIRFLCMARRR